MLDIGNAIYQYTILLAAVIPGRGQPVPVSPPDSLDEWSTRAPDSARPRPAERRPLDSPHAGHPASSLRSVLVEYADRPDRRTICPKDLNGHEVMVTWLTADADGFVDLLERR